MSHSHCTVRAVIIIGILEWVFLGLDTLGSFHREGFVSKFKTRWSDVVEMGSPTRPCPRPDKEPRSIQIDDVGSISARFRLDSRSISLRGICGNGRVFVDFGSIEIRELSLERGGSDNFQDVFTGINTSNWFQQFVLEKEQNLKIAGKDN